jgi:hypothetical protein
LPRKIRRIVTRLHLDASCEISMLDSWPLAVIGKTICPC